RLPPYRPPRSPGLQVRPLARHRAYATGALAELADLMVSLLRDRAAHDTRIVVIDDAHPTTASCGSSTRSTKARSWPRLRMRPCWLVTAYCPCRLRRRGVFSMMKSGRSDTRA